MLSSLSALDESSSAGPSLRRTRRFALKWDYVTIFLVILLIGGIRFRLRDFPLERDEGEYAYAGQLILHGIPEHTASRG